MTLALAGCQGTGHRAANTSSKAAPKVAKADEPVGAISPRRLRLMNATQYSNTLVNIFGPDLKFDIRFPPRVRTASLAAAVKEWGTKSNNTSKEISEILV